MTDIRKSPYQGDAATVDWTGATQTLDSAIIDEWTSLSTTEVDNTTNGYLYMDIEVYLASVAFTGADSALEIYLVPTVDGTNYPNWTDDVATAEQENNQYWVGSVTTSGATEAQRMTLRGVEVPTGKFKFACRNSTGVNLTTGNTVKYRFWTYKSA